MTPKRGRGRPTTFDEPMRDKYLALITAGMHLGEAADHLGIHRNTPTQARRTDRAFAAALDTARARGRQARIDDKPHDDYRYTVLGCRCETCRAAHTQARRGRRHTQHTQPEGEIIDMRPSPTTGLGESVLSPLLLARAS